MRSAGCMWRDNEQITGGLGSQNLSFKSCILNRSWVRRRKVADWLNSSVFVSNPWLAL